MRDAHLRHGIANDKRLSAEYKPTRDFGGHLQYYHL